MGTSKFNAGGNPVVDKHPIQGGVEILPGVKILPIALCCRNRDKLQPDGPLGSYEDYLAEYSTSVSRTSHTQEQSLIL